MPRCVAGFSPIATTLAPMGVGAGPSPTKPSFDSFQVVRVKEEVNGLSLAEG